VSGRYAVRHAGVCPAPPHVGILVFNELGDPDPRPQEGRPNNRSHSADRNPTPQPPPRAVDRLDSNTAPRPPNDGLSQPDPNPKKRHKTGFDPAARTPYNPPLQTVHEDGFYMVGSEEHPILFRISRYRNNLGLGICIQRIIGGHTDRQVANRSRAERLLHILDLTNPVEAMRRYASHIKHCGRCGVRLTADVSTRIGFGPKCALYVATDADRNYRLNAEVPENPPVLDDGGERPEEYVEPPPAPEKVEEGRHPRSAKQRRLYGDAFKSDKGWDNDDDDDYQPSSESNEQDEDEEDDERELELDAEEANTLEYQLCKRM
jgi:hypothetical protein